MATRLGLEGVVYRNSGTYVSPVLVKVGNVRDLTMTLETNTADVTTRDALGWRQIVAVLRDATIDFNMLWKTDDENFQAIKDAFLANTVAEKTIEFFILSADVDEADSEGLRASFMVTTFNKNEPLEEAQNVDITLKPTISDHAPEWVDGAGFAAYD